MRFWLGIILAMLAPQSGGHATIAAQPGQYDGAGPAHDRSRAIGLSIATAAWAATRKDGARSGVG